MGLSYGFDNISVLNHQAFDIKILDWKGSDKKGLDWEGLFSFPILFLVILVLPCVKCNVQNCKMKILKWQNICRVSQKMKLCLRSIAQKPNVWHWRPGKY